MPSLTMRFTLLFGTVLVSAVANGQSISVTEEAQVIAQYNTLVSSITANPTFTSDASIVASNAPSAATGSNLVADAALFITATTLPTFASAVPPGIVDSLENIAAKPIEVAQNIAAYVASVMREPEFSSAISVLATAVPSPLRSLVKNDPAAFLAGGITASVTPTYLASLPTDVQSELVSFINGGLSIIAADLAAETVTPAPFVINATTIVAASGTGAQVPTTSALPFTSSALGNSANILSAVFVGGFVAVVALL